MKQLIDRLKEPSTYAGLTGIAVISGRFTPESFETLSLAVAGAFAFIAMLLPERKA